MQIDTFGLHHKCRCSWCNLSNPRYVRYHDEQWGVAVHDDRRLFEMLLLECFQAGLSWECILNKWDAFSEAFDGFDYKKIAKYDDFKIQELRQNKGIVRNRLKIVSARTNAQMFMVIQAEYGSFDRYIWGFTNGNVIYEYDKSSSPLSDSISQDLRKRGMKFVGTTIVYSFLQAIGIINSHQRDCWKYNQQF